MQFLTYAKLTIPAKLRPSFKKVRQAIERDDFASPDVKKLTGTSYYRAKLDYENRVLLRFVEYAGKRACLALELIEHHAYDRSRFLRGVRLDDDALVGVVTPDSSELTEAVQRVRYLHPTRPDFELLDKPISFDDRQAELYRLPLPLILVGCAGSGKTALTLTKLRDLPGDVLYVTRSPYLAESAQNLYFANGYENAAQSVDFLSYAALLESVEVPRGKPVTLRAFQAFFQRHAQGLRFTSAHQLFEELRGVVGADADGPLSLEAYLARGVRQSIYAAEERRQVHGIFMKYRAWLEEAGLYDSNLVAQAYRSRIERRYDAAVVDEVQDLTNAELALVLASLKASESFLLCGDANQIVHPNFFSWSSVKSLFYVHEDAALKAPIHVLEANYRSSRAVCTIANDLLKVKNARFGSIDRESTALVRPASDSEGSVIGLVKKDAVLRALDERTKKSAEVAVIVLTDERKAEARQKFSTPLVFSIHEAKGLEYDTVILYDIISGERARFRELTDGVSARDLEATELTFARARDKTDKSLEEHKFFVNALYVALTRAVSTIFLVESDVTHPLLGLLRVACGEEVSTFKARTSSLEEWQREARRLELQGKNEQADAIRKSILRIQPVPWPVLDRAGFGEAHARAFQHGSVFAKAKQRVYEFAAFHGLGTLATDLKSRAGMGATKPLDQLAPGLRERNLGPYRASDLRRISTDVDRYGVEHRNMMGMTPLMMAADVSRVDVLEALLERGARIDAVDTLGRMPVHFALRRAFVDQEFAERQLGTFYALLCPNSLDLEVDSRRMRLAKTQGEFLLLCFLVARIHVLYQGLSRYRGFSTAAIHEELLARFPRSVVPEERRRRTYWNGVFARAEVTSSYRPQRKLWRRERVGHYMPNDVAIRVASENGEADVYLSLLQLLGIDWLEPELARKLRAAATPAALDAGAIPPPTGGTDRAPSHSQTGPSHDV